MNGTSMAAPTVASQASLLKSIDKELSSIQLKQIIEKSSIEAAIFPVQYGLINVAESLRYYHTRGRIFGANSLETSMQIAKEGWNTVNETSISNGREQLKGKFSVLASNQSFADSLSVVPLAYKVDSPIFLSEKNYLPQESISTMKELGVDHVIVIGGKNAISESVELNLQNHGFKTTRIYGKTRYETAVEIGKFVAEENGEVMVVNGKSFPDALSASVEAATQSMPIIFVEQNALPDATKDFLSSYHFSQTYIIGGKQPVSATIEKSLDATRISGSNRYETNIAVASYFNSEYRKLFFATGADFKDALTGGLLAAKRDSGLMLVPPRSMDGTIRNFLQKNPDKDFNVLGGRKAIPSNVIWEIDRILSAN
jgi:cell wall-associated protease